MSAESRGGSSQTTARVHTQPTSHHSGHHRPSTGSATLSPPPRLERHCRAASAADRLPRRPAGLRGGGDGDPLTPPNGTAREHGATRTAAVATRVTTRLGHRGGAVGAAVEVFCDQRRRRHPVNPRCASDRYTRPPNRRPVHPTRGDKWRHPCSDPPPPPQMGDLLARPPSVAIFDSSTR